MTPHIGDIAFRDVCIREMETVTIMTSVSQDTAMDSIGTASGVSQNRIVGTSVSHDTDMGGTECSSDPRQVLPTAVDGCV